MNQNNSNFNRIVSLFISCYFLIYMFPFPIDMLTGIYAKYLGYPWVLEQLNLFIGRQILGIEHLEKIQMTGSGDTTFDYVMILTRILLSSILAGGLFTLSRRKKWDIYKFEHYIFIYGRYFVGLYMLIYGSVKFMEGGQFSEPNFVQLEKTFGEASPMNLMWTFMGYSNWYSMFAGAGEIISGLLIMFRRTKVLGALITIGVMTNVVMMNLSYDIPVKLFSCHLVLLSIFIVKYDIRSLIDFFLLNKQAQLNYRPFQSDKDYVRVIRRIFKPIIIALVPVGIIAMLFLMNSGIFGKSVGNESIYGVYKSDLFVLDQDTLAPLTTDSLRWEKLILDKNYAYIKYMKGGHEYFNYEFDEEENSLSLESRKKDSDKTIVLSVKNLDEKEFVFTGKIDEQPIYVKAKLKKKEDYPLMNRGFHWVNEYPYNR